MPVHVPHLLLQHQQRLLLVQQLLLLLQQRQLLLSKLSADLQKDTNTMTI
jgi:hypothetical protein